MEENRKKLTGEDAKITKAIGKRIAHERKRMGITQVELANRLKMNQSMICSYEQGRRRIPLVQFVKIAKAIGVPPEKLLNGNALVKKDTKERVSRRFTKRLDEIAQLPEYEKKAIIKTIDALLLQYNVRQEQKQEVTT